MVARTQVAEEPKAYEAPAEVTIEPVVDRYWEWPGTIELAEYDPEMPPEEMTNEQWAQWAFDQRMPKWAIMKGILQRTPPTITGIEPSTAAIGDPSFTLYVSGTNFHTESRIVFAGQTENTTLGADGRLYTGVNMDYWHGADAIPVIVDNGMVASEPSTFTFTAAAPPADDPPSYDAADPDDLEEEIEEAKDDGDVKLSKPAPHKPSPTRRR